MTPLYPTFEKRINDTTEQILRKQIEPWAFFNNAQPLRVTKFDGSVISYNGIIFDGSVGKVFWERYIDPFIENLVVTEFAFATASARERKVDGQLLLREVSGLLINSTEKIYKRMATIDQRLRGNGFPNSVPPRSIEFEVQRMKAFIEKHSNAEIEMWSAKSPFEEWFDRNKFWVWAIGTAIAIIGIASKIL